MKAVLMYKDRDCDPLSSLPANANDLIQDLELDTLFGAMAIGDKFLQEVAKKAILLSLNDVEAIVYRQQILKDCLEHPAIVREIYRIIVDVIESERRDLFAIFANKSPDSVLHRSIRMLELFFDGLMKIRRIADEYSGQFKSEGFIRFFEMLERELNDEYLGVIWNHLAQLKFPNGVLISAELGKGNKGTNYVLRRPSYEKRSWMKRIFRKGEAAYSFEIADRDISGMQALSELRNKGINSTANALAQSTDHILGFFKMLRIELGFYVSCLNLHDKLLQKDEPVCIPVPLPTDRQVFQAQGLCDVCLTLKIEARVVGNNLAADNKELIMITGANQGGKSTFLRSIGLAQLMMQCGMFVSAKQFTANVCNGVFTHFKREEDVTMKSGKLDEELGRMSKIADHIRSGCILLCNESFSSTNEREGSEIARQIIRAFLESGIKILFVTHLFDLAQGLYNQKMDTSLFLRAEREIDGRRTFKIAEGEPLPTSYGLDLYRKIFVTGSYVLPTVSSDTRP